MAIGKVKVTTQMVIGAVILMIGSVLLAYMVVVESEPGAIPLLLVAVGATWYFIAWRRQRSRP